jgi:hypothetical protein
VRLRFSVFPGRPARWGRMPELAVAGRFYSVHEEPSGVSGSTGTPRNDSGSWCLSLADSCPAGGGTSKPYVPGLADVVSVRGVSPKC